MSEFSRNTPRPIAGGEMKQPAEPDDAGWFEPYVPPTAPRAPQPPPPKPKSLGDLTDEVISQCFFGGAALTKGPSPLGPDTIPGNTEAAPPSETASAPVEAPQPPPRMATAPELVRWIKICLLAKAHLTDQDAELIALWVISTWFREALTVHPCLMITGSAHDARRVLHVLEALCPRSALVAGFRRPDLNSLGQCWTLLISEPNVDKRTAALLSCLTDSEFRVAEPGCLSRYSMSTAIYLGENPDTHKIYNSIHLHLSPTNAEPGASTLPLSEMRAHLPGHLGQYRVKHDYDVRHWTWTPCGLSPEMAAIAKHLGDCIIDAPELRQKLVALLKAQDKQRISEMSNSTDAVVLTAAQTLSRDGRENAYAHEIAAKANRIREAHGERARLSAENVGHTLKKLGLRTRRLSQSGNGLTFDKATVAQIQQLAAMYGMEDPSVEAKNLHCPQDSETNEVG